MAKELDKIDQERRNALAKLAQLSAYSAPAVVTLLSPQISHAQTSAAINSNDPGVMQNLARCLAGNRSNMSGNRGLGNDSTPGINTTNDCGR